VARVCVVDPRRARADARADLGLPLRPGPDSALS
jgi:anaerobic selenocysteine-containing dehydrogenase